MGTLFQMSLRQLAKSNGKQAAGEAAAGEKGFPMCDYRGSSDRRHKHDRRIADSLQVAIERRLPVARRTTLERRLSNPFGMYS